MDVTETSRVRTESGVVAYRATHVSVNGNGTLAVMAGKRVEALFLADMWAGYREGQPD